MHIKAERSQHNNQGIIKLIFDYNREIVEKIRTIPGVRWDRVMRCWYVADQPQKILSLIYSGGLRRSELINMQIIDVDSKRNVVNIRHAKGDKDGIVPLSGKISTLLRDYFKQYRPPKWLFEGQIEGTQYTETSINHIFQRAKKKANITRSCTLHTLRHCYATHLLEAGTDIRYIQALLGHKHSKTTEIYTHVTTKSIQKIKSPFDDLEI